MFRRIDAVLGNLASFPVGARNVEQLKDSLASVDVKMTP